jgi:hypothetical protein
VAKTNPTRTTTSRIETDTTPHPRIEHSEYSHIIGFLQNKKLDIFTLDDQNAAKKRSPANDNANVGYVQLTAYLADA